MKKINYLTLIIVILTSISISFAQCTSNDECKEGYYCKKPIYDNPVKLKLDGKDHYLCCQSCARLFKEKYERIKAEAD